MTNYRGAASFCSTVDDLLKFAGTQQPVNAVVAKPGEFLRSAMTAEGTAMLRFATISGATDFDCGGGEYRIRAV